MSGLSTQIASIMKDHVVDSAPETPRWIAGLIRACDREVSQARSDLVPIVNDSIPWHRAGSYHDP